MLRKWLAQIIVLMIQLKEDCTYAEVKEKCDINTDKSTEPSEVVSDCVANYVAKCQAVYVGVTGGFASYFVVSMAAFSAAAIVLVVSIYTLAGVVFGLIARRTQFYSNFTKLLQVTLRFVMRYIKRKTVYLFDTEGGDLTKDFAKQFKVFVSWSFEFVPVTTPADCTEGYPIALLLRRQTDRAAEDITAMKTKICEEGINDRTALIYIHVVIDEVDLPLIPTKDKVMNFKTLGIILDFGYNRNNIRGGIYSCNFEGKVNSREAFENCVIKTMAGRIHTESSLL